MDLQMPHSVLTLLSSIYECFTRLMRFRFPPSTPNIVRGGHVRRTDSWLD